MLCAFGPMLQPAGETAAAAATNGAHREGGGETSAEMAGIGEESGGGGSGGNRWPRQETLALLQIRSDMDAVFRDSSHKGPLWDEISRKMADMGYKRSAKKCREKFENVYKYHKRTKDGRATKSDGKHYRFFEQLQALESANAFSSSTSASASASLFPPIEAGAVPIAMAMPPPRQQQQQQQQPLPPPPPPNTQPIQVTVLSTPPHATIKNAVSNPMSFPSSTSGTPSSSSSTSSDEEVTGVRSRRKRKWKEFFEKLTRDVTEKQEELHRKFLEALDKRESERRVREEAWKAQEMARLKLEYDNLVQERSATAAKDAALVSFLQRLSEQQKIPLPPPLLVQSPVPPPKTPTTPAPVPVPVPVNLEPKPTPIPTLTPSVVAMPLAIQASAQQQIVKSNGDQSGGASSSRWPKAEIDALIKLRTNMDHKYQDNGPKGVLWEEISRAMRGLGYNRNAKRCKEKWENINKYFKRMKEGNKRRRDDAKTCPYYHQLEELYKEKKTKVADAPPIMAQPEQQWPLQAQQQPPPPQDHPDHMDQDDDEDEDEDEDEDLEGGYEIVANNNNNNNAASMGGAAAAMQTS